MKSRVLTAGVLAAALALSVATPPLANAAPNTIATNSSSAADTDAFDAAYERVRAAEAAVAEAQAAYDTKRAELDARAAELNAEVDRASALMEQRQAEGDTAGYEEARKQYQNAYFARYDFRYAYKFLANNEGYTITERQEELDQARGALALIGLPAPVAPEGAAPYTVPGVVDVASELEYAHAELARKQEAYDAALAEVDAAQAAADPKAAAEAKAKVEELKSERSAKFLKDTEEERRRSEAINAEKTRTSALIQEREAAGDADGLAQAQREYQAALDAEQEFNQWRRQRIEADKASYAQLQAAEEQANAQAAAVVQLGAVQAKAYAALKALVDERQWVEALTNAQ